jgi:hypothetical protein
MTSNKVLLFLSAVVMLLISCKGNQEEAEVPEVAKVEEIDNAEKTEIIFEQFKFLYDRLIEFKGKDDFKKFGLGEGGPYNKWLKEVEQLENNPDSKLLLQRGVVAGELKSLGMEYVRSNGKETSLTREFNKIFVEAISTGLVDEIKTASGSSNYDKIKSEYELFGKWEISNTAAKSSYHYEIYRKGNEYIGVIPQNEYKTEILEKKGNDYYVKGNKFGEFYRVDSSKNMTLFDEDGDLTNAGYKATLKQ